MIKKISKLTLASLVVSALTIMPVLAAGATIGTGGSFSQQFAKIFNFAVGIAGLAVVIMFLVGGIMYLTSAGNEESANKAKKLLVDAVVGLVIVVIAWSGGKFIAKQLGADTFVGTSNLQNTNTTNSTTTTTDGETDFDE